MKGNKDKIREALKDSRNGKIQTIYRRIWKTGSPFKTQDKRCTRGGILKDYGNGITAQLVAARLRYGWSVADATTKPPRRHKNEQDS